MPKLNTQWKTDNYKFVGKAFDFAYANLLNKLLAIVGEADTDSVDYELTGTGGYGEMPKYDGNNLNFATQKRAFKTIITPEEFNLSDVVGYKAAKIDKLGECRKVGTRIGRSAAMTVYLHVLRMFGNALNENCKGGDGKPWAATDHPIASKGSTGRVYVPDPEAGTFSNKFVNKSLTVSALTDLQSAAKRFITSDGLPFIGQFNMLLVSPELEEKAAKICGKDAKYRPRLNPDGTANNAANPVYDMQYMVIGGGNDGFSAKQWALCDASLMREIVKIVYITRPCVFRNQLDNPLQDLYAGYADFGAGWGDARQIMFAVES